MSNWELISYDPNTGLKKYIGDHPDDSEGCLVRYEQSAQSIQKIIDANKASQIDNTGPMGDFEKAASIPIGVMFEWKQKYNVDAWNYTTCDDTRKRVNALLNSSDYRYLKCRNIII